MPLRICLLSNPGDPPHREGLGYTRRLGKTLRGLGHRVDVVSGPPYPEFPPGVGRIRLPSPERRHPDHRFYKHTLQSLSDPIDLMGWLGVFAMGIPDPLTFSLRVKRFLARNHRAYDVVHDNQSLCWGMQALDRMVPLVATIHHPAVIRRTHAVSSAPIFRRKVRQLQQRVFVGILKWGVRSIRHVVTGSFQAQRDVIRNFFIPRHQIHVIPIGIDIDLFHPVEGMPREMNRIVVADSDTHPTQGLQYLLPPVARLVQTRKIRLTILGAPGSNGAAAQLIRHLGLGHAVDFIGPVADEERARHYRAAAMAVIPTPLEGFGASAGEAMACGTPVIGAAAGALPELVGDAGILVAPRDSEAFFRAMTFFLDHPDRAARMGRAGLVRVHRMFTWEKTAQETVAVYRKAIRDFSLATR